MIEKLKQRRRAGHPYVGPAAWCDDYTLVPRPGYYALTPDGKRLLPRVPLVCVDDAPGNHLDGACHYEYAGPKDYPQRSGNRPVTKVRVVHVDAHDAQGTSDVGL